MVYENDCVSLDASAVSNAPTPSIIPKSADTSSQKPSQPVLKAPSLQSSSMSSDSAMPSTPSKGIPLFLSNDFMREFIYWLGE